LVWCVEHLGELPSITVTRTGASIADRLWKAGGKRNSDIAARDLESHASHVLSAPVPVPPITDPPRGLIEPPLVWSVAELDAELVAAADRVLVVDQRGAYLGSAGMVGFPVGDPVPLMSTTELESALWFSPEPDPNRWPTGLWLALRRIGVSPSAGRAAL
ncbi:hypothetical protein, partial [Actinoplanes sp. GCM10030250]|uniref:hypothetical protein n=1 Tax=Actinoplanes sp. GCM10030250 TaxID=3273376 RepID=UPI003614FC64